MNRIPKQKSKQKIKQKPGRILLFFVLSVFAVIPVAPWLFYALGLLLVDTKPDLDWTATVTAEQRQRVWHYVGGTGEPVPVSVMTPYDFPLKVLKTSWHQKPVRMSAQEAIAVRAARNYLIQQSEHERYRGYWHFKAVCMTVWLTRNADSHQIYQMAYESIADGVTDSVADTG